MHIKLLFLNVFKWFYTKVSKSYKKKLKIQLIWFFLRIFLLKNDFNHIIKYMQYNKN
jgi:hypothetical protein